MKHVLACLFFLIYIQAGFAQPLKIKDRKVNDLSGTEFFKAISDSALRLENREELIYQAVKNGNIPDFLRKLSCVTQEVALDSTIYKISFFTLPDYMAIGNNEDFFYIPMTPILAQRVAKLLNSSLPTKRMVDLIYQHSEIKLAPSPIPPTRNMTTVPVFKAHNETVQQQLLPFLAQHREGKLTAGHKKDIIISNKVYSEKTAKVVIYGWHQLNGKAIQPVYNKHSNTWADYSHGIRLILNKVIINGKKTTIQKVLSDQKLYSLLSDEGIITRAYYP